MVVVFCPCLFVDLSSVCLVFVAHVASKELWKSNDLDTKTNEILRSIYDHYVVPLFVCCSFLSVPCGLGTKFLGEFFSSGPGGLPELCF